MANEITISASLGLEDSESSDELLQLASTLFNITTKVYVKNKQNVGTSEEAIELGTISSLGWAIFINRDATNYVEIRTGTGGNDIVKIPAGGVALFHFGSDVTAPYIVANTAACQVEYLILSV